MVAALRFVIALFGVVCVSIALTHIAFGPAAIPGSLPINPTMDSEGRFFATLFLGFGGGLVWTSRDLERRGAVLAGLLVTFYLGGIARIISWLAVGRPDKLFIYLCAVELILPLLLWLWYRRAFGAVD